MRRLNIIFLLLSLPWLASAQGRADEMSMLRLRNLQLQRLVDSLKVEVGKYRSDVFDAWSGLDGLEGQQSEEDFGGVSGFHGDAEGDFTTAQRVYASSPSLKLEYRGVLKRFIEQYTGKYRRQMQYALGRYNAWFPYFREVFSRYGIPDDIIPLCIVESAVSGKAVSRAGAVGLWQFMPETARTEGLTVNGIVDQRYNIEMETVAAASFLKKAYAQFGDWTLAVASYNCGANNVRRAMIKSGRSDFWGIYEHLPEETRDYIPLLVAANYIVEYCKDEGMTPATYRIPAYTMVTVPSDMTFEQIVMKFGCSMKYLQNNNPEYFTGVVPAGYMLKVKSK